MNTTFLPPLRETVKHKASQQSKNEIKIRICDDYAILSFSDLFGSWSFNSLGSIDWSSTSCRSKTKVLGISQTETGVLIHSQASHVIPLRDVTCVFFFFFCN